MLKSIGILALFLVFSVLQAQDTTSFSFTATYQGKNLYVQNPVYNDSLFCTCEVKVNQREHAVFLASSSYEIDLSSYKIGDTLQVQIIHYKTCKPKLLNPYTGHSRPLVFKSFSYLANILIWECYELKGKGMFYVEHFEYNNWETIERISFEAKEKGDTAFIATVYPFSGNNKYRIKYIAENGEVSYSCVLEVDFEIEKLNVKINNEAKKIYFSRENDFYIMDERGIVVLEGFSTEGDISNLSSGVYYLNADNETKKFKIK